MTLHTDEIGRLLGVRCHDGNLVGLDVRDSMIELRFRRVDGTSVRVLLDGVRSFAMDRFLEGNIVDAAYAWPIAMAPKSQRQKASTAFSCDEFFFDQKNDFDAGQLFVLESSYGASIYALVRRIEIIDDSSGGQIVTTRENRVVDGNT